MNFEAGIILDIIVCAIFLFSVISGVRKGFALTLTSFMQWFICIIVGFFFVNKVKAYLIDYTTLDDYLNEHILSHIQTTIEESSPYQAVPDLFSGWVNDTADDFVYGTAASITSMLMTVIAFLVIVFGIKVIGFLLMHLFSKKYNDGVTGFLDGFIGLIFGAIRGLLYVFLFCALLVPVLSILWPSLSEAVVNAMKTSYLAGYLYNDNVLLILIRDLFS